MTDDPTRPQPPGAHRHHRAEDPPAQPCGDHSEAIGELLADVAALKYDAKTHRSDVARLDRKDAQQDEQLAAIRRDTDRHESRLEDTGRRDRTITERTLERMQDAERIRIADEKAAAAHAIEAEHAKASALVAVRSSRKWDVIKMIAPYAAAGAFAGGVTSKASAIVQWVVDLFRHGPPKGH